MAEESLRQRPRPAPSSIDLSGDELTAVLQEASRLQGEAMKQESEVPALKSEGNVFAIAEELGIPEEHVRAALATQRRKQQATGRGVAVPHGRTLAITRLAVVFARSAEGVEFDAMDGKPVHLLFLTVAPPQERSNLYLPVLGKIVEMVKSVKSRRRLLAAADYEEVAEILEEADEGA